MHSTHQKQFGWTVASPACCALVGAALLIVAAGAERAVARGEAGAALMFDREVSELRLRDRATVAGDAITWGDVLDFSAADPRLKAELAARPLVEDAAGLTEITYEQVVERLDAAGVNLARVLVVGAYRCQVQVSGGGQVALASDEAPSARDGAAVGAWPDAGAGEVQAAFRASAPLLRRTPNGDGAVLTLEDHIRQHVLREWADAGGTPELAFERGRDEFLSLTSPPFEFNVRSGHGERLGLREFKVVIYRDGRLQRTVSVFARVSVVREVLVAARPLNIGTFVRPDAVLFAKRIFDSDGGLGITDAQQVIGQALQRFVPEGQMLRIEDLKAVEMVQRSRPVTVYSDGAVQVRLTGTALDGGGLGEMVRVRIGESRGSRRIVRGQVTGVARVKMLEGE